MYPTSSTSFSGILCQEPNAESLPGAEDEPPEAVVPLDVSDVEEEQEEEPLEPAVEDTLFVPDLAAAVEPSLDGAPLGDTFVDPMEPPLPDEMPEGHMPLPSESASTEAKPEDPPSTPKGPPKLGRGKSHVFHASLHGGDEDGDIPATQEDPKYEETDEQRIAQDKRLPLNPLGSPNIAELEEKLKALKLMQRDMKAKKMVKQTLASAAADAHGAVIEIEDTLPIGKDTADTMEYPDTAVQGLMDKFNAVEAQLELEDTAPSDVGVPWQPLVGIWFWVHT